MTYDNNTGIYLYITDEMFNDAEFSLQTICKFTHKYNLSLTSSIDVALNVVAARLFHFNEVNIGKHGFDARIILSDTKRLFMEFKHHTQSNGKTPSSTFNDLNKNKAENMCDDNVFLGSLNWNIHDGSLLNGIISSAPGKILLSKLKANEKKEIQRKAKVHLSDTEMLNGGGILVESVSDVQKCADSIISLIDFNQLKNEEWYDKEVFIKSD